MVYTKIKKEERDGKIAFFETRPQEQMPKPMIRVFYPKLWMKCRNQSMHRKKDISRLTCGHNKKPWRKMIVMVFLCDSSDFQKIL